MLSIFDILKTRESEGCTKTFTATKGWFQKFQTQFSLQHYKVYQKAGSADEDVAKLFVEELDKITEEGGYLPEQIFNVDETGLFWKKIPERNTFTKKLKPVWF